MCENLHLDGGLPEMATGAGFYSQRLSYKEWYSLACARLAYQEQVEGNPRIIFNLLVASMKHPIMACAFGVVYVLISIRRTKLLFRDNGYRLAKRTMGPKCIAMAGLKWLAICSMVSFAIKTYNVKFFW